MSFRIMDAYRRFARNNAAIFISVNMILASLWISVIMGFSGENAQVSGGRSARILVGIINVVAPSADVTLENYEMMESLQNAERIERKAAHMFEYGVLTMFVWAVLFGFVNLPRKYAYIISVIFAAVIGIVDEVNQTTISGREGSWIDVCVDTTGAGIALFIAYRLTKRYRYLKQNEDRRLHDRNAS